MILVDSYVEVTMPKERQALRRLFEIAAAVSALMIGVVVSGAPVAGAATSAPVPVVTSVSPAFGTAGDANTTLVMISGANLAGATSVHFGADNAPDFQVNSSTLISVNTPPAMAGTVDVTVTTPAGTSATSPADKFVFQGPSSSPPVVTSLSPSSGPAPNQAGGPPVGVLIDGSNFIGATAVHFGSISVPASMSVVSATEIGVVAPPELAGTVVDVTVTTAAGTSATSPADRFTYTATLPASGYWEVASDGGIFSFGDAPFLGSMGGTHLNAPVVGMAIDQSANGYFEVASDGGIFSFGDALFRGSMGGTHLNSPIVGMALDADTGGYWEVAADGGVFSFDAPFLGSLGGTHLNSPIVGMAPSPFGHGYWLAAADGAVYSFGGAPNLGSAATSPTAPVVSITSDQIDGYWLITGNGTLFPFGSAPNEGSTAALHLNKPIVGMAPGANFPLGNPVNTSGYWEVGADGGIFTFGTPGYYGSMGGVALNAPIVGIASTEQPGQDTGP
jgi:hypothetical protein